MRSREEILDDMNEGFYRRTHVTDANERLTIEILLDLRDQNQKIIDYVYEP